VLVTPEVVIVGAMRCGTTTLFRQLERAAPIHLTRLEDLHYFDRRYHGGLERDHDRYIDRRVPDLLGDDAEWTVSQPA